jgi:hypothetical protein
MTSKLDQDLAPFQIKGHNIQVIEHAKRDSNGDIVQEGTCDWMEREFRTFKLRGNKDPNSGAELVGDEADFYQKGKEARDERLVGMTNGGVAIAAGSLKQGSGLLYDMNGRPLNSSAVPEPPVKSTKRSPRDW